MVKKVGSLANFNIFLFLVKFKDLNEIKLYQLFRLIIIIIYIMIYKEIKNKEYDKIAYRA